jgi:uncharacterized membrane-anchored protein
MIALPANHEQRFRLNDEIHARPPDALAPPLRMSFIALWDEGLPRAAGSASIRDLAARFGLERPDAEANHFSADLGPCRVTWERHTEFSRYSFIEPCDGDDLFDTPAVRLVPRDWLAALPGRTMAAINLALVNGSGLAPQVDAIAKQYFEGNPLIGARIADGAGIALTDFRIRPDGFTRMLVFDDGLAPRQAGRTVQRLLEIDAYRLLATLALPVARELTPFLSQCEADLADVTARMVAAEARDEPKLLDRLIRLEAQIENQRSKTVNRFSASVAYYDLVQRRIDELREARLPGLQTFKELTERRLVPAMNTCKAVSARQEALSQRVTQATQLISTRVAITRELQNQAVLASMDRRAKLQLRLQQTVEGLSVAAVTYYVVGLVSYLAKGMNASGFNLKADLVTALSIPVVALLVFAGLHQVRQSLTRRSEARPGADQGEHGT